MKVQVHNVIIIGSDSKVGPLTSSLCCRFTKSNALSHTPSHPSLRTTLRVDREIIIVIAIAPLAAALR